MMETYASEEQAAGFREHRKRIKAPLSARAEKLLCGKLRECAAQGVDPGEALDLAVERGWRGVEAEWIINAKERTNGQRQAPRNGYDDQFQRDMAFWTEVERRTDPGTGYDDGSASGGHECGNGETGFMDRGEGFGASVALFPARRRG